MPGSSAQATNPGIDLLLDDAIEAKYGRFQKYARQDQNSMFKISRPLRNVSDR